MVKSFDISQEIFSIDMLTAKILFKASSQACAVTFRLYGDQA